VIPLLRDLDESEDAYRDKDMDVDQDMEEMEHF